jgi:hypothetical protein
MVSVFIGSLKVAVIAVADGTPVAPAAGNVAVTVGAAAADSGPASGPVKARINSTPNQRRRDLFTCIEQAVRINSLHAYFK